MCSPPRRSAAELVGINGGVVPECSTSNHLTLQRRIHRLALLLGKHWQRGNGEYCERKEISRARGSYLWRAFWLPLGDLRKTLSSSPPAHRL